MGAVVLVQAAFEGFDECISIFSARTSLDKYGPQNRYDFFTLLPGVRTPLLITLGGEERDSGFRALAETGEALVKQIPGAGFPLIPGADHFYTGRSGELWAAARFWMLASGLHAAS